MCNVYCLCVIIFMSYSRKMDAVGLDQGLRSMVSASTTMLQIKRCLELSEHFIHPERLPEVLRLLWRIKETLTLCKISKDIGLAEDTDIRIDVTPATISQTPSWMDWFNYTGKYILLRSLNGSLIICSEEMGGLIAGVQILINSIRFGGRC